MKIIRLIPLLTVSLLVVILTSCGPSYVGVGTTPNYGYGPGYYAPARITIMGIAHTDMVIDAHQ